MLIAYRPEIGTAVLQLFRNPGAIIEKLFAAYYFLPRSLQAPSQADVAGDTPPPLGSYAVPRETISA